MDSKRERILSVLDALLDLEDIYACMVVRKHMDGIVPPTEKFSPEVLAIWKLLQETMDEFFEVLEKYSQYGISEVYFRLMDYVIMFFVLPKTTTAVVAIVPELANRGLIEISLERSRLKIIDITSENE